jgi:hypothetical protein
MIVGLAAVAGCTRHVEPANVPASWTLHDAGKFNFWGPPELKRVDLAKEGLVVIDSYLGYFKGDGLLLDFDYGYYSNDLSSHERSHYESVGGRLAKFASADYPLPPEPDFRVPYPHWEYVYFAHTAEPRMRLHMSASCRDVTACRTAQDVFRSVRF